MLFSLKKDITLSIAFPPEGTNPAVTPAFTNNSGASIKGKKEATIVVFGDSDFVNNSYLNILGNKDFFLNTVSFLAEEKDLISIRPKTRSKSADNHLVLSKKQSKLIFWLAVIIEPALVLLIGVAIFFRRRIKG